MDACKELKTGWPALQQGRHMSPHVNCLKHGLQLFSRELLAWLKVISLLHVVWQELPALPNGFITVARRWGRQPQPHLFINFKHVASAGGRERGKSLMQCWSTTTKDAVEALCAWSEGHSVTIRCE